MEKQTIIFTALPNGREADGSLRLSVFISPRLWSDDPNVAKLELSKFPDFVDWTTIVSSINWKVAFGGGPTLNANVVGDPPEAAKWSALFKTDTDVIPYRFDDYRGSMIETFPSDFIHDFLAGVYSRAASEPSYGAGKDLPPLDMMANDRDIVSIARPSRPEKQPEPSRRPDPVDLGGTLPEPEPDPGTKPDEPKGCGCCGCLSIPFAILGRLFPPLKTIFDKMCGAKPPASGVEPPALSIDPKPTLPPPPPPLPEPIEPPPPVVPEPPPSAAKTAFTQLAEFLKPDSTVVESMPTLLDLKDEYDFHKMVSALGDYPILLRKFGLVVDLVVPIEAVAPPADAMVQVEVDGVFAGDTTSVTPRTHYQLGDTEFSAKPRPVDPEISNGLLRLDDTDVFRVIQVDVVGGGTKMQNAATNIARDLVQKPPTTPDNTGLPALRTAGISIIRLNMPDELIGRFRKSHALQSMVHSIDNAPQLPDPVGAQPALAPTDELFAEDLVRGYRVDVFDKKSNSWHSLCDRDGRYNFLDAPGESFDQRDEGFVQFAATEPLDNPAQKKLKTSDSLFVWDGWSLCAPRPGQSVLPQEPGDPLDKVRLGTPKSEAITNFKLETSFEAAERSLPRLRFDYEYRLRARVCDLAGNSVFDPADDEFLEDVAEQTADFPCARYEPVSPPALMLRAEPVEGESVERLVVRTPAVAGESQTTERHIVPPKVSQLMAEQHGKFDGLFEMDSSAAAYNIAAREAGSLNDNAIEVKDKTWANSAEQFVLTYLPDPAARGVVLLGLPGLAPEEIVEPGVKIVNKIPFDGAWPDPLPFRLKLKAIAAGVAPAEPQWDGVKRVLTVELPEAEKAVVRVNSYLNADDLERQGVWQWTKKVAPVNLAELQVNTIAGRSWLHAPWREITLVHAVQKPIVAPKAVVDSPADKKLGDTFAVISGKVVTHPASTSKVDLIGEWEDPIDDPKLPAPTTRSQKAHLCEVPIDEGAPVAVIRDGSKPQNPKHNFGDTKFHTVFYQPVGTTRFREYFPPSITKHPANLKREGPKSDPVLVLNSARPEAPKALYVVPTYEWLDVPAAPGTVKRTRKGGGLRVYLDRGWYSSGAGELLGVVYWEDKKFLQLDEQLKKLVTHWGVDPIWMTGVATETAHKTNFSGFTAKADGVRLFESQQDVSVVGYPVHFDNDRKLWFADIEMNVGDSYAAFIRLALVRFQPNSVQGAEISPVVRAEFAQLAPRRSASVTTATTATGATIHIGVKGLTFQASSATAAASRIQDPFGKDSGHTGHAATEALLQKRDPGMGQDPHLGWNTISTTLLKHDVVANLGSWEGFVTLGEPLVPDTFRILLQEYEWYRSDNEPEDADEKITFARRIVYADAIPLG
jgi:hypothetical protein